MQEEKVKELKYKEFEEIFKKNKGKLWIKMGINSKNEWKLMKFIPKKAKESKIFAQKPIKIIEFYNDLGGFLVRKYDLAIFE